jgi:hypothetical protein
MTPKKQHPPAWAVCLTIFLETTDGQAEVSISDLLDSLSSRSHGPMLLFPPIVAISPVGMIPGMSLVTGTLVILIATQIMLFASRPWIPKRLANFEFSREKLKSGVQNTTVGEVV